MNTAQIKDTEMNNCGEYYNNYVFKQPISGLCMTDYQYSCTKLSTGPFNSDGRVKRGFEKTIKIYFRMEQGMYCLNIVKK